MSILIIDPSTSGASGDLLVAALLNSQTETFRKEFCQIFQKTLSNFDPDFEIQHFIVQKKGFEGSQLHTIAHKKFSPDNLLQIMKDISNQLKLSLKTQEIAFNALESLIAAEKHVHGIKSSDKLHFHELATIDTVFDIMGFTYLLERLELQDSKIYILPIAVGGGKTKISHGLVSVPTPVTLEIIRKGNLIIRGGPVEGELLTPTGASILTCLKAIPIEFIPVMQITSISQSFGTREYGEDFIGGLRIIRGTQPSIMINEEINILETNIDDVDGEIIGYLFEILFAKNLVLDLNIINTISKKNRPGFLIRAIVEPSKVLDTTRIMSQELGTLGVRVLPCIRHIIPREKTIQEIDIFDKTEVVQIKKGYLESDIISEKIEYDDLRRIAKERGIPLQKVRKKIYSEIRKKEGKLDDNNE